MEYIIDAKPKLKKIEMQSFLQVKNKIEHNIQLLPSERELFLNYYIQKSRTILSEYLQVDITDDPLVNTCDLAQHIIGKQLESNKNILVFPKESQKVFYPTCIGHSFLICIIQGFPYLIDLTYRQFFLKENCSEENFIYLNNKTLKTPEPGFFMMKDDTSIKIAKKIIENGFIELNLLTAKKYGDSFYFTKTGDSNLFDIHGNIYLNSLMKENHYYAVDDEKFKEMYGKVK